MWKWLRSWFAWRFSLRRLMAAVLISSGLVGLNVRSMGPIMMVCQLDRLDYVQYRGWPLPYIVDHFFWDQNNKEDMAAYWKWAAENGLGENPLENLDTYNTRQVPWTHQTYRLGRCIPTGCLALETEYVFIIFGLLDALFALTILALILFLQIPRRKEPSAPPPVRAGG